MGQVIGEKTIPAHVVDQDIYLSQFADRLPGCSIGALAGGQFSVDRVGAAAQGTNFRTDGVQLRRCACHDADVRSLASVGQGHGAAQPAATSGYQGDFAFQLHLCFTFLRRQGRRFRLLPGAALAPCNSPKKKEDMY